jgi:hypothetical protein
LLDKTKPAASFRWQRVIGESFFARFGLLAQEHDHQPATVVVMPMSIVAVICSKHHLGLYPTNNRLVKFI